MLIDESRIREAESRFGVPVQISLGARLDQPDMELVAGSLRRLRTHDVTLFIVDGDNVAVIRKPTFPPGAYRAPSGGLNPGETIEEGALREAFEETGLHVRLERYLLRISATFSPLDPWPGAASLPPEVADPEDASILHWWTHVFSATVNGERVIRPRDNHEIQEAKWVTLDELQGPIRQVLLDTGKGLFRYRVELTDITLSLLGWSRDE